jgi:hypothetical protein
MITNGKTPPPERVELRNLDAYSERERQRAQERERKIYARLDSANLVEVLSECVNETVQANAYLAHALRRVAREGNSDALRVEKYLNRANVEVIMAKTTLLCELRGLPDWRTVGEE